MSPAQRNLLNFIVFQLAWFACVLGGARGLELAGTLVVVAAVALHLALVRRAAVAATLVAAVATIGLLWDSLVVTLGLMTYPSGSPAPGLAPVWIGAVGGPLAYFAGARLGGIELSDPAVALAVQGLGWSLLMPLLAWLASRLDGFEPVTPPPSVRLNHGGPRHA